MAHKDHSSCLQFHPSRVLRVLLERGQLGNILVCDIALGGSHLGQGVKVRQAVVHHIGSSQALHALLQTVGEDGGNTQHLSTGLAQHINHFQHRAAGGDQILNHHDFSARLHFALNLVLAAVILMTGAHITHGQVQNGSGNGCVGNTRRRGAHQHLRFRELLFYNLSQSGLHIFPYRRSGQSQPVIAVNGAVDTGSPGKGIVRL